MPRTNEPREDVSAYHNAPLPRWLEGRAIIAGEEHYLDADAALQYCAWAMGRGLTLLGVDWALCYEATQSLTHLTMTEDVTTWPALIALLRAEPNVRGAPTRVVNIWVADGDEAP